jgi:hypothetical protein
VHELSNFDPSRRLTLASLSSLWLAACGGGNTEAALADGQSGAVSPTNASSPIPAPPAPVPAPVPAPPAPTPAGTPAQFLTWDAGSGPSRDYWSRHLLLRWKNPGVGDWTDAAGNAQGAIPFATVKVDAVATWCAFDATTLTRRWLTSGENKGLMLRISGSSSPSLTWSGRQSEHPPVLEVKTSGGATVRCPCFAFSTFSPTSTAGMDSRQSARTSTSQSSILQFNLSGIQSDIESAQVRLYCEGRSGTTTILQSFECDPPRFQLGSNGFVPQMGLAAKVGEAALRGHPSVLKAGDFSDIKPRSFFDTSAQAEGTAEQLPDPDAPGTIMYRGKIRAGTWDQGELRGSASFKTEHMRANYDDPKRPAGVVEERMFCRLYIFLEDDWRSVRDGNKMAIGWDLRMGWWNPAQGGYWQSTTGNGGARGSGRKFLILKQSSAIEDTHQWMYEGHAVRMEAGKGPSDPSDPYESMRPVQSYTYNLDQASDFGDMIRLGNAVIRRGRWHCIEQEVRMNSVVGPFDSVGNGEAVADGVLRSWLDGVLVSEVTNLRWRRHPDMGIQGPWINWFYGGKQPSEVEMHYRMNHFVVAREYIGPRPGMV